MSKTWRKKKKWYDDYNDSDSGYYNTDVNNYSRHIGRRSNRKNKRMIRYDGNTESEEILDETVIVYK